MSKMMKRSSIVFFTLIISFFITSCGGDYIPKPKGYIRFDLPKHEYKTLKDSCPYSFEIGQYSLIEQVNPEEPCWKNIFIKPCRGRIHLSYKPVNGNLKQLLEDAHSMVYGHTVKADAIEEQVFLNPARNVYGVLYDIKGDAASNIQFIATDSVNHYLRGALYFRAAPNEDSLAPLVKFARKDIEHLIETLRWE
ncbi:gliding motility lipoprotein GldD [Salinivirga cyanobacteriivorans]|uniref:Gliding motility-associated lipoprotein GldD n=1 Tax=Salinivirga cyanobacteriivorans TaxID=1307839 RepID=A0A0S2I390_9BACT|nr:gliding motility lipoprotein GldD [Salinivirga cyanobacteriivorans]ALO16857.1 gliding motility-associated lipoprotein GldD [Salinivirga cyanobacteriivorans]